MSREEVSVGDANWPTHVCSVLRFRRLRLWPSGGQDITVSGRVCNLLDQELRISLGHGPWRFTSHGVASIRQCSLPVNLPQISP
jgi:hypothetical protein